MQDPIGDMSILGTSGVILEFTIAPARIGRACADIEVPAGWVNGRALEFVTPDQLPVGIKRTRHAASQPYGQEKESRQTRRREFLKHRWP